MWSNLGPIASGLLYGFRKCSKMPVASLRSVAMAWHRSVGFSQQCAAAISNWITLKPP